MDRRSSSLPPSLPPRGLSREQAAEYVGVSATKFDEMIADGRMPRAIEVDRRRVWDRRKLDRSFDALAEETATDGDVNEWDTLTAVKGEK
jgi:excisionase family DNA binding protein